MRFWLKNQDWSEVMKIQIASEKAKHLQHLFKVSIIASLKGIWNQLWWSAMDQFKIEKHGQETQKGI